MVETNQSVYLQSTRQPDSDSESTHGRWGHNKYKTKADVFKTVTPILLERFWLALVAQCHQGSHLAVGPVAQQTLDGTYVYPPDLDPTTRLLFEVALATFLPCHLPQLQPTSLPKTPNTFGKLRGSGRAHLTAGCTLATLLQPPIALISFTACSQTFNLSATSGMGKGPYCSSREDNGEWFVHKL
jgi:hypothetical protein